MAINIYRIKKWCKMLAGKSILHVDQDLGKKISPGEIKGYYNDLTQKVVKDCDNLNNPSYIPKFVAESGIETEFPISIIQYGLGCYDLYLESNNELYRNKFFACVEWVLLHQKDNGALDSFLFLYPNAPYSAMCQGEAASLLLRAWRLTDEEHLLLAAKKAIDFMLLPVCDGGTALYENIGLILLEYTNQPCVLNGWIFAAFGLYDMSLAMPMAHYRELFSRCVEALKNRLPEFDNGYWSMYDTKGKIASPFYHGLHIAQLQALYMLTDCDVFKEYANRFDLYKHSFWKSKRAFLKKAIQKILE